MNRWTEGARSTAGEAPRWANPSNVATRSGRRYPPSCSPQARQPPQKGHCCSPHDRLTHPPASLRAARQRARRGRRSGRGHEDADGRHRRRLLAPGARRGRGVPARLRGRRLAPERGAGLRRGRPGRTARARRPPALRRDRRDGPRLLPRHAPRADQERAFAAQIALARGDRETARDPHARGRRRDARPAGRRSRASAAS